VSGSVTVFCGSKSGVRPAYRAAATALGEELGQRGLQLVYGGAGHGLMGALADAVLSRGGRVVGVIPEGLDRVEFAHPRLSERIDVASMHERKAIMADRADAFIALPGGFGTLDELFEVLTWRQLSLHRKPIGLLDVEGYFAPLIRWADTAVSEGFVAAQVRETLIVETQPARLLTSMLEAR
jgi:uncharacterized protein (TIGR00730 family)